MKYYYITYTPGFAGNYLAALIMQHSNFYTGPTRYGDKTKTWLLSGMFDIPDITVPELEEIKMHCQRRIPTLPKVLVRHDDDIKRGGAHNLTMFIDNLSQVVEVNKELKFVPIIVVASNLKAVVERSAMLAEIGKIPKLDLLRSVNKQAEQIAAIEKFQLKTRHDVDYMYVDTTKLIAGDVIEYLALCEGIGEMPDVPMFLDFMLEYTRDVWKLRK